MDGFPILPFSIAMSTVSFTLIAVWYLGPLLDRVSVTQMLNPLLLFHSFRHVGLAFLVSGVTAAPLDPRFAQPAAYGDLLAAVLALLSVIALRTGWAVGIPLVWLFSVEGIADLLNAVYQGLRHTPDGHLGATYFIPAVVVPALLVTHALAIVVLVRYHRGQMALAIGGSRE